MISTALSFILVLGILIFFHELGHYWVARRNGIIVEEFGMGYPPRAAKLFTYKGTDFTLNWIPFGGFARMKGEDAGDMSEGSFNAASAGGRARTLAAGPAMNFILAILFFAFSFMAGFPAPAAHPMLTDIPAGSTAAQVGLLPGDILLQEGDRSIMVSAWEGLNVRNNGQAGDLSQLTILRDGQQMVVTLPANVSTEDLLAESTTDSVLNTRIVMATDNSPAQAAGIQEDDRVYSVNGTLITPDVTMNSQISQNLGEEVAIVLLRDGQLVQVNLIPRENPPPGDGAIGVAIESASTLATMPFLTALWEGVLFTVDYITFMVRLPFDAVAGALDPGQADLLGPVGIAQMVGDAVDATVQTGLWYPIWRLSAILSAALAITNLLPIPALDGGRLVFILIEVIRGRRVSPEREGLIHMIGFAVLLGLMVLITFRDINTTREGLDWIQMLGQ